MAQLKLKKELGGLKITFYVGDTVDAIDSTIRPNDNHFDIKPVGKDGPWLRGVPANYFEGM